jgi:hypothetical protein
MQVNWKQLFISSKQWTILFLSFSCSQSTFNNHPSIQVFHSSFIHFHHSFFPFLFFSFLVVIFTVKVQCLLQFFDHIYNKSYHILRWHK